MCIGGSSSIPSVSSSTSTQEQVASPTYADATVTKATTNTRNKAAALAGRNIKTSARGLTDESTKDKNSLLGE